MTNVTTNESGGKGKRFKWTIEISVDEIWVADGFDMTDDRATEMMLTELCWAGGHEVSAKVLETPKPERIRKAQGG